MTRLIRWLKGTYPKLKKNKKKILVLFIVLIMLLSPLIVFIAQAIIPKPQRSIDINFNYADGILFDVCPVVGLEYVIKDGVGTVLMSGVTDSTGMVTLIIKGGFDQSGLGVHVEYMWHGISQSLNNLMAGEHEIILATFSMNSNLFWADDLSLFMSEGVEVWHEGVLLWTTIASPLNLNGFIAGTYTLKDGFVDTNFTIEVDQPSSTFEEDIFILAEMDFGENLSVGTITTLMV